MGTITTSANYIALGELYFSGSQPVVKGAQVSWVIEDAYAFRATEKCRVSTNATPFVNLREGDTFQIYKRTQKDEDEGNYKGIYIFDRDTIVTMAYPQDQFVTPTDIKFTQEGLTNFYYQTSHYVDLFHIVVDKDATNHNFKMKYNASLWMHSGDSVRVNFLITRGGHQSSEFTKNYTASIFGGSAGKVFIDGLFEWSGSLYVGDLLEIELYHTNGYDVVEDPDAPNAMETVATPI